jgi:hypothetical protein
MGGLRLAVGCIDDVTEAGNLTAHTYKKGEETLMNCIHVKAKGGKDRKREEEIGGRGGHRTAVRGRESKEGKGRRTRRASCSYLFSAHACDRGHAVMWA